MPTVAKLHTRFDDAQIKKFDKETTIFHIGGENYLKTIFGGANDIEKKEKKEESQVQQLLDYPRNYNAEELKSIADSKHGRFSHNYKQTLKYYLKENTFKDIDLKSSKEYLQQKKDLIVHLRNIYSEEAKALSTQAEILAKSDNQKLSSDEKLAKIHKLMVSANTLETYASKITTFAEVLKELIRDASDELAKTLQTKNIQGIQSQVGIETLSDQ